MGLLFNHFRFALLVALFVTFMSTELGNAFKQGWHYWLEMKNLGEVVFLCLLVKAVLSAPARGG